MLTSGQARWNWFGTLRNFSTWQGTHAQDVGGAQSTALPPTGAAPTPTLQPTQPAGSGTPTQTPTLTRTPAPTATQSPTGGAYDGTPAPIPGRIQAENYDWGANGAAYNDTSPGQEGGALYRAGDVDLKLSPYGGVAVGWFIAGEWLAYTVNVATTGYYDISIFGGTVDSGRQLRLEFGGINRTGSITLPQTADWQTYTTVTARNIYLTAGQQVLRIVNERGYLDVDWVEVVFVSGVTSTPTPTLTPSITPTPSATPTVSSSTATPTPTPAPTFTPSPTSAAPSVLATRQADYYGLQTQVAVAAATQSALQATQVGVDEQIAQQQAELLELTRLLAAAWQAIRSWYGGA
ncbi:MAG: carbohydrate-binding protein [Chloroflexota bacterium]|nr:carbohydrate-binding protein [Chloroflexota bacterium]